jgi:O-antigen ligase
MQDMNRVALNLHRERFLLWALLPVVVLGVALTLHPALAVIAAAAVLLLVSARRSVAYPLGLAGFAAPIVALLGRNPFPKTSAPLILFGWLLLAVLVAGSRGVMGGDLRKGLSSPFVILTGALFVLMLVRLPGSSDSSYAHFKLELFVMNNLMLLVAGIFLGRQSSQFDLYLFLALILDALSGILVLRSLGGPAPLAAGRYGSNLQNVIALGSQGAEGLMIATYLTLKAKQSWLRLFAAAMLPVTLVALLASGSRGPVIGGALGVVALLVLLASSRTSAIRIIRLFVVFAIAWIAVNQVVPQSASHRAISTLTGTASGLNGNGRSQLWSIAWQSFLNHPMLGVGTGSFPTVGRVAPCPGPACLQFYPHNILLEVAVELGILGLFLTVALLITGGKLILRVWRRSADETRARASILFALYLSAVSTSMLTGDISGDSGIWLVGGVGIGLSLAAQSSAVSSVARTSQGADIRARHGPPEMRASS